MCDREHFDTLCDRVDRLEEDVKVYHARTDERLKTLFQTCEKLSSTAATLLRAALTILGIVLIVSVFALGFYSSKERKETRVELDFSPCSTNALGLAAEESE